MLTFPQIRALVARDMPQATQEVQNFIAYLEQKQAQIDAARALLEQSGFTVTAPA